MVSLLRLLRSHLGPYRRTMLVVVVLQAIQTTAALVLPTLNAAIIDEGVLVGDNDFIRRTGLVMIGFSIAQIVFSIGAIWFGAKAAMAFGRDIRRDLFDKVTSFSAREIGHFGAPTLITRITNDVQQVQMLVVLLCTMMIAAPMTMVVGVIMAVREEPGLSPVLVVSMPAAVIALGSLVVRMVPAFQRMQAHIDRVNLVLREQITGVRVVRAFVRERREEARFEEANADLTDASLRAGRLQAGMFPTVILTINLASIAVLWVGADRINAGTMELGSLVAYLSYLVQILMAVVMATFMLSMIPRAAVAADRIVETLGVTPSLAPAATPVTEFTERATLELDRVEFRYFGAAQPVLRDVSFRAAAGQTTAIIGSTGAGKSTLVGLIPRLFDPTAGTIRINGENVAEVDADLLAATVALVPQRPFLFSGTVASNLRFARPDATEEEMWTALETAQAAEFVRATALGLDAPVQQGAANLSGGQRQRLAIARALIVQPEIYVFDDSFSALDVVTAARLRAALTATTRDATVVIVAQRISTIVDADRIIVLESGEVAGIGTHESLLKDCPTYAEIVESQRRQEAPA
ncbi:MAG: ABC transporter ATP-binding protein [Acidimicrobiales bacterium]